MIRRRVSITVPMLLIVAAIAYTLLAR